VTSPICSYNLTGAKGEPGLAVAEKGLPGPRGLDGSSGLPGSPGTPGAVVLSRVVCLCCRASLAPPHPGDARVSFCWQVHRVDPDRTASLACREQRGTLDSQASDYRDPRGSKVGDFAPPLPDLHILFLGRLFQPHHHLSSSSSSHQDSQVPTASQDLLQDQEDRESMDSPASPDFLDPRYVARWYRSSPKSSLIVE